MMPGHPSGSLQQFPSTLEAICATLPPSSSSPSPSSSFADADADGAVSARSSSLRPTMAPSSSYTARRTICGCSRCLKPGSARTTRSNISSLVSVSSVSRERGGGEGRVETSEARARRAEVRRKAGSSCSAAAAAAAAAPGAGEAPSGVDVPLCADGSDPPRMTEKQNDAMSSACSTTLMPSACSSTSSPSALSPAVSTRCTASQLLLASRRTVRSESWAAVHQAPT